MSDPVYKPRLPTSGSEDGDQVVTSSGNIFEFNAEKNEWVCIGILPQPDVVTTDSDGLVPPDVYRKLVLIQELIDKGFDFGNFKLDTDVDNPYFYYLHSSDDLIKFAPEKCPEPKEVRLSANVTGIDNNGDNTTTITIDMIPITDFKDLVLETPFCNYTILSNEENMLIIDAHDVNVLSGDAVKVVKPESVSLKLRVEIDKGRLYQKLVRTCCIGPKGLKGTQGDTGTAGDPASNEVFQTPVVGFTTLEWDTTVETPIGTPISIRFFDPEDDVVVIEVLHFLDGTSPSIIMNITEKYMDLDVETTTFESNYDPETEKFSGSITILGVGDLTGWRFKTRQRGAKGNDGDNGKTFLEVVTQLLDDPSIRSTEAIISMRKGAVDNDIILLRNSLFDEVPVSNLSALAGDPITDILEDQLAAVGVTIEEAKDIGFYQFRPKDFDIPPLDIPLWTPTSDCVQTRRWAQYRFDWFNQTDPDYLYNILLNPKPAEACCQEDFFYCPNVGDNPCGIGGEISPPTPPPTDCICECENPIASELSAGGLTFSPIDLTLESSAAVRNEEGVLTGITQDPELIDIVGEGGSAGLLTEDVIQAVQLNTAESVIDGIENKFKQNIKLVGNGEVIITLDYDADPCGGAVAERQSCAFVDSNAVRSFLTLVDKSGTAVISSGGMLETKTIPITAAFTIAGGSRTLSTDLPPAEPGSTFVIEEDGIEFDLADLELNVAVNTTGVEYCRGYRITITTFSDEIDLVTPAIITTATATAIITGSGTEPSGSGSDESGSGSDITPMIDPPEDITPMIDPPEDSGGGDPEIINLISIPGGGGGGVAVGLLSSVAGLTVIPVPPVVPVDVESYISSYPGVGINNDGVAAATMTVFLGDVSGDPVAGESVTLSSTGSNNTFTPISGTTDAFGIFTSLMTSITDEVKTVSANVTSSIGLLTDTASVTFAMSTDNSTVIITGVGDTSPMGGPNVTALVGDNYDLTEVTVTALDSGSMPIMGAEIIIYDNAVVFDNWKPDEGATFGASTGFTDAFGEFKATMSRGGAGFSNISASIVGFIGAGFGGKLIDEPTVFSIGRALGSEIGRGVGPGTPPIFSTSVSDLQINATNVTYELTIPAYYTPAVNEWITIQVDGITPTAATETGSTWDSVDGGITVMSAASMGGFLLTITRDSSGTVGPLTDQCQVVADLPEVIGGCSAGSTNPVGNDGFGGPNAAVHVITLVGMTNPATVGPAVGGSMTIKTAAPVGIGSLLIFNNYNF